VLNGIQCKGSQEKEASSRPNKSVAKKDSERARCKCGTAEDKEKTPKRLHCQIRLSKKMVKKKGSKKKSAMENGVSKKGFLSTRAPQAEPEKEGK